MRVRLGGSHGDPANGLCSPVPGEARMSLINKMLRDLDAREQEGGLETNLPLDVRPLPSQRATRWPFAGSVLLVALPGGLAYVYWGLPAEEVKPAAVQPAPAVPEIAPAEPPPLATAVEAVAPEAGVADSVASAASDSSGSSPFSIASVSRFALRSGVMTGNFADKSDKSVMPACANKAL